ncbi:MAG TPA: hypothetical protein VKD72_28915 [Gemmataceae bacterium]|nr:hypothetical protein [Gemmataceae bacterium]
MMLAIVLIVLFTVSMFLWLLALVSPPAAYPAAREWLAFCSVLFLALLVILTGTAVIVFPR